MGGNSQIDNSPGVVPFRLSVANYNYSVNVVVDNINLRSTVFGCELPATNYCQIDVSRKEVLHAQMDVWNRSSHVTPVKKKSIKINNEITNAYKY